MQIKKDFDKIHHLLFIKTLGKLTGNFFNLMKGICEKPTTNIILNDEG